MKKLLLLCAALGIAAGAAWGESSRMNRDDNTVLIGFSPVGLHVPTLLTTPLQLALVGENFTLGVEFGRLEFESSDVDSDSDESFEGEFTNSGVFVRWFPGTNSFNFLAAVHQRNWDVSFRKEFLLDNGSSVLLTADLVAEATVGTLGVSNQWTMDFGMVIGVDWLALSQIMSETASFKVTADTSGLSSSEVARYEKDMEEGAGFLNDISGFPGALILSLGFSF